VTTEAATTEGARSTARVFDLALQSSRQGLTFGLNNHGITLADDRLDWTIGGTPDAALLASIVAINLRSGGSWQSPLAQCRITFRDGFVLTVSDAAWSGYKDESKGAAYRDFVHDLHRRLAALPDARVDYTSGFTKTQFHVGAAGALFFVALCFVPLIALLVRPDLEYVYVFFAAGALTWPLLRMLYNNSPGTYDPRQIPPQILP
jgi:hypothetical protein